MNLFAQESWVRLASAGTITLYLLGAFYLLVITIPTVHLASVITDTPITSDEHQRTRMGYHLVRSGMYAYDDADEATRLTMRREPLPPIAVALYILAHPQLSPTQSLDEITRGSSVAILKQVNIVWVLILFSGIITLVLLVSNNIVWRMAAPIWIIYVSTFAFLEEHVDRIHGELPASALMAWVAVVMLLLVRSPTIAKGVALGVLFGALALVKSFFMQIFFVAVVMLSLVMLYVWRQVRQGQRPSPFISVSAYAERMNFRELAKISGAAVVAFSLIVSIWSTRNAVQFGEFRIIDRGGQVVMYRLLLSEFTPMAGTFFVFSPRSYQNLLGPWLGFSRDDIVPGGRLEAFNRQDKSLRISNRRFDMMRERIEEATGDWPGRREAQGLLFRDAVSTYARDPLFYLKSVALFSYRGSFFASRAFSVPDSWSSPWLRAMPEHLSLLLVVNFIVLTIGAFFLRKPELFIILMVPFGVYAFLGMFSHNISRYNMPVTPYVALAFALAAVYLAQAAFVRFGISSSRKVGARRETGNPAGLPEVMEVARLAPMQPNDNDPQKGSAMAEPPLRASSGGG